MMSPVNYLQNIVNAASGGTLAGIAIGDMLTQSTWSASYADAATPAQIAAGNTALQSPNTFAIVTAAGQEQAIRSAGLAITSTATPANSATYALDSDSQLRLVSEAVFVLLTGTFRNGTTSTSYPDINGNLHVFTIAQFKALAGAIEHYLGALDNVVFKLSLGTLVAWPTATATVA